MGVNLMFKNAALVGSEGIFLFKKRVLVGNFSGKPPV